VMRGSPEAKSEGLFFDRNPRLLFGGGVFNSNQGL